MATRITFETVEAFAIAIAEFTRQGLAFRGWQESADAFVIEITGY